ncbi:TOBE domain-containing protein [Clostridium estertheticum]|uniref:TOBE domain-containing protein n=1 Tax=Clostridium estertheticum TaxID=238834 RepID=UPI001CF33D08|nr:TOBE domain-containing protein [Clostridium estertheticum]MCB2352624.1 TOBE domain-containing protein [Clostridium estertheticum]WAG39936.1 TOBE domain-containing protein [Clostridium estertheticum]
MTLSARNQLKGKVVSINEGAVTAYIVVDIGGGNLVTSSISIAAVHDLDLKVGSNVTSVIKASSVMLMTE